MEGKLVSHHGSTKIEVYNFAVTQHDAETIRHCPTGKVFNSEDGTFQDLLLTTDSVSFKSDNSAVITLHGIKNDYDRDGFDVMVRPATEAKVCPVATLRCDMERTKYQRPADKPLFIALTKPFGTVSAKTIGRILDKAIKIAGLSGQGYSAKCFHPTGATVATESGLDAEQVRRTGRWKSKEVFEEHYVHARPAMSFTDNIFNS